MHFTFYHMHARTSPEHHQTTPSDNTYHPSTTFNQPCTDATERIIRIHAAYECIMHGTAVCSFAWCRACDLLAVCSFFVLMGGVVDDHLSAYDHTSTNAPETIRT